MKLEGYYTFHLPIEEVYHALKDEALIRYALPGQVHFRMTSPTHYEAAMDLDVPRFGGHYSGSVEVIETEAPFYYRLRARGRGLGRDVEAEGLVELMPLEPNVTELHYVGVTDALDGLNSFIRMAAPPVATRFANRGLEHLERAIQERKRATAGE